VRPLGSLDPWSLRRHPVRKRLLLSAGAGRLLQEADGIHYTSEQERHLAERSLPSLAPGVVIPLGVDDVLLERPPTDYSGASRPYLLSLSRLDPKKGIDLLIGAFHTLGEGFRQWQLVIAGDGEPGYVSHLRRLSESGPARSRIEFRGWVAGEDRVRLIQRAALYALPSEQENFGISVAEAMACAVPVVVTPGVNLSRDIAAAGAGWVVPRQQPELAAALEHAMSVPDERRRRGQRAAAFVSAFRWSTVAAQLLGQYDEIRVTHTVHQVLST
jgi:glycosyltransferase involved in cell wall biosynthesis